MTPIETTAGTAVRHPQRRGADENIKRIGPLSKLKRYDHVTIKQMFAGGGRTTMAQDFDQEPTSGNGKTVKEIVEVIKEMSEDESVLIFTYKDRDGTRFKGKIEDGLARAGIDLRGQTAEGKPRVNILTWGSETSLNDYAHCDHVILAGILQRSAVDLAGAYLGATNDLHGSVSRQQINDLINSECAHVAYQAISRGRCRTIENGYAKPMTVWIIHRDAGFRSYLEKVLPDAVWTSWKKVTATKVNAGITGDTVTRIVNFLVGLPEERLKVSSKELKKTIGLTVVAKPTFTDALLKAVEVVRAWTVEGRSLVRTSAAT